MTEPEHVTREILGNVPNWLAVTFYVLAGMAGALAAAGFVRRFRRARRGRADGPQETPPPWSKRLGSVLSYLIFQRELRRDPFAGTAHLLVTYGFLILFVGTCLVFLEHDTPLHFFYGWFYRAASLVIDLGGLAFLVGLGMFLWRRYGDPAASILKDWWVASLSWLLLAIGVTGFLLEGARIAHDFPPFERWSVLGYGIGLGLNSLGFGGTNSLTLHRCLWGFHAALCVGFFVLLPWQFFAHMSLGLVSWANRTQRKRSELRVPSPSTLPGAARWDDFSRADLLQTEACTTCGRCNVACPAASAGKPLRPRNVVLGLREAMDSGNDAPVSTRVSDEVLWSCTTCAACNEQCPVGIDVYGKIVELRRGRVEAGIVPETAEQLFESVATNANPYGKPDSSRLAWAQGLDVPVAGEKEPIELLYWIGCAGSFDADGQSVATAMVKLLKRTGIQFRILGCRERCTGDPARRLGEEGLFQQMAHDNLAVFKSHGVRRILTHCPHCFNTFRNEYPRIANGGTTPWTVVHHTEFLQELMDQGRLQASSRVAERMTFHDPCYLGRGNGIVDAPRQVLQNSAALPIVEMPRRGRESFCCGAGGGGAWVDVAGADRVENLRAREALQTGASTIVTGCPFCKVMLRAGVQSANETGPLVRDVAEIVAQAEGLS